QDNYGRWALQWTEELNELGAPLYLQGDGEVIPRLESFVGRYPEIERVTYYFEDGSPLYSIDRGLYHRVPAEAVSGALLARLSELVGANEPYLVNSNVFSAHTFEILAPIWTESICCEGLFGFAPTAGDLASCSSLASFVSLELYCGFYPPRLLTNIHG